MNDIILTEKDLLNIITAIHCVKTMGGLSNDDRTSYEELLNKMKVLYASSVLSETSSMFVEGEGEHGHGNFEDEEYVFDSVPALVTENNLFDGGSDSKKIKVDFSLIKATNDSFLALVDTDKESLETTIKSFKMNKNKLLLFENVGDKEPMFEVELLEGEVEKENV